MTQPTEEERRAIEWWNAMEPRHRRAMLESPTVRDDPTPARCWAVFGPKGRNRLERPGPAEGKNPQPGGEMQPRATEGPAELGFHVGPYTYRVTISSEELADEHGTRAVGLTEPGPRRVRIAASIPRDDRLQVLLHELYHCWLHHVPAPRTEEEAAELHATVTLAALKDLDAQGGMAALEALEAEDDPGNPAEEPATAAESGTRLRLAEG